MEIAAYRTALAWAAVRGDRFIAGVEPSLYDDPAQLQRILALGSPEASNSDTPRSTLANKGSATDFVRIEGRPAPGFVDELTSSPAPDRAIAGDLCPVDYLIIEARQRALYVCYDYGTVQILDLHPDEVESLTRALIEAGLDPDCSRPMPGPRVVGPSSM